MSRSLRKETSQKMVEILRSIAFDVRNVCVCIYVAELTSYSGSIVPLCSWFLSNT